MPDMMLPPWINAADPAGQAARGLQIGMQMGAEQAAQQYQQMQMERARQQDAQAKAQWEAEYQLQASAASRKYQALDEYRRRISAGEDPLTVISEVGPSAGLPGAMEAAAIREQNREAKAPIPMPEMQTYTTPEGRKLYWLYNKARGTGEFAPGQTQQAQEKPEKLSDFDKEQLRDLRAERSELQKKLADPLTRRMAETTDPNPEVRRMAEATKAELSASVDRLKYIEAEISRITGAELDNAPGAPAPAPASGAGGIKILSIRPKGAPAPGPPPPPPLPAPPATPVAPAAAVPGFSMSEALRVGQPGSTPPWLRQAGSSLRNFLDLVAGGGVARAPYMPSPRRLATADDEEGRIPIDQLTED